MLLRWKLESNIYMNEYSETIKKNKFSLINGIVKVSSIIALSVLGLYCYKFLLFAVSNFNDLVATEKIGVANLTELLKRQESSSFIPIISLGTAIAWLVFCIVMLLIMIFLIPIWTERVTREWKQVWQRVTNCDWLKSIKDFFRCLKGLLWELVWALVEIIVLVIVYVLAWVVIGINVAPFV